MVNTYYAVGWCQHDHPSTIQIPPITLDEFPVTDVIYTGTHYVPLPEALMHIWHHAQHHPVAREDLYEAIASAGGSADVAANLTELLSLEVFVEWLPLIELKSDTRSYGLGLSYNTIAHVDPLHELVKYGLTLQPSLTYSQVWRWLVTTHIPHLLCENASWHLIAVPVPLYLQTLFSQAEAR